MAEGSARPSTFVYKNLKRYTFHYFPEKLLQIGLEVAYRPRFEKDVAGFLNGLSIFIKVYFTLLAKMPNFCAPPPVKIKSRCLLRFSFCIYNFY